MNQESPRPPSATPARPGLSVWRHEQGEVVEFVSRYAREIFVRCIPSRTHASSLSVEDQACSIYECVPELLRPVGASLHDVLWERVFFRDLCADSQALQRTRRRAYQHSGVSSGDLPLVRCLGQPPCAAGRRLELQAYVLMPIDADAVTVHSFSGQDGLPASKLVELGGGHHLYTFGIGGPGTSFRSECDRMFANAAKVLASHQATFNNVLRTWCYLTDIDGDYGEFNASRNDFFQQQHVALLPASTGIRADLKSPFRCGIDLHALLNPAVARVEALHASTLNEAPEYGSAFSRGLKIALPDKTLLYISGTASVDQQGLTVHVGDLRAQIERMLQNVQQLLEPHAAQLEDMVQVITYLKSAQDYDTFLECAARYGVAQLPNSIVEAGVCRPDLLCEMEAIAILPSE